MPVEDLARLNPRPFALGYRNLPVHDDIVDPFRILVRLVKSSLIFDCAGVEKGDVGDHPLFDEAPVHQP